MDYSLAFYSFVGRRSENQDVVIEYRFSHDIFLVGVADGMGGMSGGKIASNAILDAIVKHAKELDVNEFNDKKLKSILNDFFDVANDRIIKEIALNPDLEGMGSTLSLLFVYRDKCVWGNLGDSRIYRVYNNKIEQLTNDHSYIYEHFTQHGIEVPESVLRQYGHFLTKCLDGHNTPPDIYPLNANFEKVKVGHHYLICSDGLILDKSVHNQDYLLNITGVDKLAETKVNELISFAYNEGSSDNIAVALVQVEDKSGQNTIIRKAKSKKKNVIIYSFLSVFVLSIVLLFPLRSRFFDKYSQNNQEEVTKKKNVWQPLKQVDYKKPLKPTNRLSWQPYPDITMLDHYRFVVEMDGRIIIDDLIEKRIFYLTVDELSLIPGEEYQLTIHAILLGSQEQVEGNTIKFSLEER